MGDLALIATAFAFGVGSSVLPVFLNAEVYVVGLGTLTSEADFLFWLVMSLSVGTVLGKAVVFDLVRRGKRKFDRIERPPPRNRFTASVRRISDVMLGWLERPYLGATTVFVSSALMLPPLAVVTIIAGMSKQPLWVFLTMVFIGRTLQYLAVAFVLHATV